MEYCFIYKTYIFKNFKGDVQKHYVRCSNNLRKKETPKEV